MPAVRCRELVTATALVLLASACSDDTSTPSGPGDEPAITGQVTRSSQFFLSGTVLDDLESRAAPETDPVVLPDDTRPRYVAGELLVTFAEAAPGGSLVAGPPRTVAALVERELDLVERARRLPLQERFDVVRTLGTFNTVTIRAPDDELESLAATIRRDPSVARVTRNAIHYADRAPVSTSMGSSVGNGEPFGRLQAWDHELMNLPQAWKMTRGDPSVIVAVVDDGTRFDHPDLGPNLTDDGYDFVPNEPFDRVDCETGAELFRAGDGDGPDDDPTVTAEFRFAPGCLEAQTFGGHGLHVAGTVAAVAGNDEGIAGVAPEVRVRPVRVLDVSGSAPEDQTAMGIAYAAGLPVTDPDGNIVQADSRAHVINLSFSSSGAPNELQHEAIRMARDQGSLVIASAGNARSAIPTFPGSFEEVVAVSSVGPAGLFAGCYSNFGNQIEVAAPGGDSCRGPLSVRGVTSTRWNFDTNMPAYGPSEGTSMAAPHVSGLAALLFSQDPTRSADDVRALITEHGVDLSAPGRDARYGHGMIDALASLTGGQGLPGQIWVRAVDAETHATVRTVLADANGRYSIQSLPDGQYYLYAGSDEFDDGLIGRPPRPWGAFGRGGEPDVVTVDGSPRVADITIGHPTVTENFGLETADELPPGGYVSAILLSSQHTNYFRTVIHNPGTYVFETSGLLGACGFPESADTEMVLFGSGGVQRLAESDDVDPAEFDFCSRIEITLQPGQYWTTVFPSNRDGSAVGAYRLSLRRIS